MNDVIINALNGRNKTSGGMSTDDLKAALLNIYPNDLKKIKKFTRKELEGYYKDKIEATAAEEEPQKEVKITEKNKLTIADCLINSPELKLSQCIINDDDTYFEIIGKNKTLKRCTPQLPIAIQISAANIQVPTQYPSSTNENYPGKDNMEEIECNLNAAKSSIDEINNKDYDTITDIIEYYKNLRHILRDQYHIEFVTNAWLKLFEMHNYFHLLKEDDRITHFANADLPGTWIKATEYFIHKNFPRSYYEWRGSSLVPGGSREERINAFGDQYGLWRNNKSKWLMSVDAKPGDNNNGDTTKVPNIHYMAEQIKKISWTGVDFYTSDAGIATGFGHHESLAYNQQEQLNMKITLGALLAGLETLKKGGSFVEKLYTFFKPFTYSLILIASQFFETFYIAKPLTSKSTNSEIYLVGLGYKGADEWIEYLENCLNSIKDIIPLPEPLLPADEIKKHQEELDKIIGAAAIIYNRQTEMIKSNVDIYNEFKDNQNELKQLVSINRKKMEDKWIAENKIK